MSKKSLSVICAIVLTSAIVFCQNPIIQDGVAIFHSDTTIGRKFQVPDAWDKILIKENVTVTGSFYFPDRTRSMEIAGESRVTSIIKGDGTRPKDDGISGRSYSAIRFDKAPDVYVHDLRSLDPMKFHIGGGFGNVVVERCDLIESRGEHSSDGVHGGAQSTIVRDCYIDTWDDALYTRECTLVENTTIVHNKNGSPFMTSWGASVEDGFECIIRNCTVIDNYPDDEGYNHGVFGWAGKHNDEAQTITVKLEGSFTRNVNPGMEPSPMYTIGRRSGSTIKNATIKVDGICPGQNSVLIRPTTQNCHVWFVNCPSNGDSIPPSAPGIPVASAITSSSLTFNWAAATDNQGVNGYELYLDDTLHSTVFGTSATISNLLCETEFEFKVRAFDVGMNYSDFADSLVVSTAVCGDITSKIEAESFVNQSGIQTEGTNDAGGGQNIGYIHAGDWSTYKVYVPETDDYVVKFRVASELSGGSIEFIVDDVSKGSVNVPGTGGWQNWVTVSETFALEAGARDVKLLYNGGSGFLFNLNWFQASSASSVLHTTSDQNIKVYPNPFHENITIETLSANVQMYDVVGKIIDVTILKTNNGFQIITTGLEAGLYMLRIDNTTIKILKQ